MDERTLWLRRAHRVHSVWLFTWHVWSSDQTIIVFLKLVGGRARTTVLDATVSVLQCTREQSRPLQTLSWRPSLCRHPLLPWIKRIERERERERKRREEKRRKIRARRCPLSSFLFKNRSGFRSSPCFLPIWIFASLFMVVPPCVLQLGGNRRVTVTLAAKKTVGNRCLDRRRCRRLWSFQGETLGETCPCCRTWFPSDFRGF